MSRWFRFYTEALDDPKVQMLPGDLFKTWVNLLCVASKHGGKLPAIHQLTYLLRRRSDHLQRDLNDLVKRGLIDLIDDELSPHNWLERQYKSDASASRTREWRNRHRDVTRNDSETPPDNRVQNTDTEREESKIPSLRSGALTLTVPRETPDGWPKDFRERFWTAYPRKVGKATALRCLDRVRKSGIAFDRIIAGIERIPKQDLQFVPHPATWLGRGGWDDEEIPGGTNGHRGPRALQDDRLSVTKAADRLIEQAERGEFSFGPRPSLLPQSGPDDRRLLPKG